MEKVNLDLFKAEEDEAETYLYCSVLITCKKPDENGAMEVELSYEGDKMVGSYLINSAQQMFNPEG